MNSILYVADASSPNGFREASLDAVLHGARQALAARVHKGVALNSPRVLRDLLLARL